MRKHASHKINSQDECAGRRVIWCPCATARAPEFPKINNIYLKYARKNKLNKFMITLGIYENYRIDDTDSTRDIALLN